MFLIQLHGRTVYRTSHRTTAAKVARETSRKTLGLVTVWSAAGANVIGRYREGVTEDAADFAIVRN